ncbi:hypothetical protein [Streptomyces sp. NPDC058622]|uniref:hypothetical protein n=1 Tax=Streptomyces sp. NPDC058622 TaxID=3346562 RepID=UPI00364E7C8F
MSAAGLRRLVEGLLLAAPAHPAGRAGQVGLEQEEYVLTALSGFVAPGRHLQALVYRRSDSGRTPAGPLVRTSEDVQQRASLRPLPRVPDRLTGAAGPRVQLAGHL